MPGAKKGRRVALLSGIALVVVLAGVAWASWDALRAWYRVWCDFESLGNNAQGYPEYRDRMTGIVFVSLPGGEFWMGAQREDPDGQNYDPLAREDEGPVHKVFLSPFLITKYEVSQAEWERVMESNPSEFKGETRPVENVSWEDCQEFCRKTGLRLPTEAEWEYACRAGSNTAFCFGDDASLVGEYAWYFENSGDQTHPAGTKKPNAYGLHDMHGNVLERCEDVFDPEFYSKPQVTKKDPLCMSGSGGRVLRGGCWGYDAGVCRSAFRVRYHPGSLYRGVGFRPSMSISP